MLKTISSSWPWRKNTLANCATKKIHQICLCENERTRYRTETGIRKYAPIPFREVKKGVLLTRPEKKRASAERKRQPI